jgi:fructoselysine and glucoselysine-specific PTS system IIC component
VLPLDNLTVLELAKRAVTVALAGGILGLDNIAVGQFMLAQPVVGAVLAGFLVGEPLLGVWAALTFQLLWVGELPVGAYVPPNAAITAVAAVGLAVPSEAPFESRAVLAATLAVPVGIAAGRLDMWIKARNVSVLKRAEEDLLAEKRHFMEGAILQALARWFLKDFILLALTVFAGCVILDAALPAIPARWHQGMALAYAVLPAVGAVSAIRAFANKKNWPALIGGAGLAAAAILISVLAAR